MNIKDLILFILIIITIYILYKSYMFEKFDNNIDIINEEVDKKYKIDIDALRNISSFSNFIINNNNIILPINTIKSKNLIINGKLTVEGDVDFTNDNNILDIFPVYMIIAWFNNNIPLGWAICDGTSHIVSNKNNISTIYTTIKTPDLRGRMIIGASSINEKLDGLTNRLFNTTGGLDEVLLTEPELPNHIHKYAMGISSQFETRGSTDNPFDPQHKIPIIGGGTSSNNDNGVSDRITSLIGENKMHNNLPPCTALYYIMRIK
jgi:microcystin-dependent protein